MTDVTADPPPCILSYRFATAPAPLQASGTAQASPGMVNVWISAPAAQPVVYCNKIIIAVPVGPAPGDFSTVTPALTPNTTWWVSAGAVVGSGADLGLPAGASYAIFTVTCPSADHWKIDYRLAFSVTTASVSPHPGTFPFIAVEYSSPDRPPLEQRKTTFTLSKAPAELYLGNLITVSPSQAATTVPRTEFRSGQDFRLLWQSNGTDFSLYQGGRSGPVWTGADTSYTVRGGVTAATTFTLVASMKGTPGAMSATVAVTIRDPSLTPASDTAGSLTVVEATGLAGAAQFGNVTADGRITVAGAARLAAVTAPSVTVSGPASLQSATMAAAAITGPVGGPGTANLGTATAASVTVTSSLTALTARPVNPGQDYTASSDGFLVGTVGFGNPAGQQCATRISGTVTGVGTAYATGGNTNFWRDQKNSSMWGDPGTFVLPVPKGATFRVGIDNRFGAAAPTAFQWYPLARSASLSEVSLAGAGLDMVIGPGPVQFRHPSLRRRLDRIVSLFGEAAGDRLTPPRRERLAAAIESLLGGSPPRHR